jgi:predicted nucleic acid-binding Zn ribbon protein
VNAPAFDSRADERIASLEKSVTALEARVDAQARQMRCFEMQRETRAAWSEHDGALLAMTESACNEVAGLCPDTGLPPNTFGRYRVQMSPVAGEVDAPLDTLRARMDALPKLPQARVPGDVYTRIRSTRAAAESATQAYLAECDPAPRAG